MALLLTCCAVADNVLVPAAAPAIDLDVVLDGVACVCLRGSLDVPSGTNAVIIFLLSFLFSSPFFSCFPSFVSLLFAATSTSLLLLYVLSLCHVTAATNYN